MDQSQLASLFARLSLERRGDFVEATVAVSDDEEVLLAEELGILMRDGSKLIVDEFHASVESLQKEFGDLWTEPEPEAPTPIPDPEELRWYAKMMSGAAPARGVAPAFPVSSIEALARLIRSLEGRQSICIMSGAGMSTSAGIADFRSSGTGFYEQMDAKKYGLKSPEDVFNIECFRENPLPFFQVERDWGGFYGGRYKPTRSHKFIARLHEKQLLLRSFTQNVDGLEVLAGVPEDKIVEAHGSYRHAECIRCRVTCSVNLVRDAIFGGDEARIAYCPQCKKGVLKPACVFFGEKLPSKFWREKKILSQCQLLLVMGTSLQVEPFASLVDDIPPTSVRVLFNREAVGPFLDSLADPRSFSFLGDLDDTCAQLASALGWEL